MFSVTEEEIYHGLLADADSGRHCLAFVRSIHNINLQHDKAWRFIDQNADGSIDEEAQQLKQKLHQIVQDNMPQENIFRYERVWNCFPVHILCRLKSNHAADRICYITSLPYY